MGWSTNASKTVVLMSACHCRTSSHAIKYLSRLMYTGHFNVATLFLWHSSVCLHPNAVKRKTDPTSDEPASVAVEITTVLTESLKGQQHRLA